MLEVIRRILNRGPGILVSSQEQTPAKEPVDVGAVRQEQRSGTGGLQCENDCGQKTYAKSSRNGLPFVMPSEQLRKDGCDLELSSSLLGLLDKPLDMEVARQEFLQSYCDEYDDGGQFDSIRQEEFRRLHGQAYLDYAGASLYSERQIQACSEELLTSLMCNPHSAPSSVAADALAALRRNTLELMNADGRQYEVVITSGATAALKLVAECFPWSAGASRLAHPAAVHNSVLGMRGLALAAGAAVQIVQMESAALVVGHNRQQGSAAAAALGEEAMVAGMPSPPLSRVVAVGAPMTSATATGGDSAPAAVGAEGPGPEEPVWNLLALPAECNFTGDREPLEHIVRHVQMYGIDGTASAASEAAPAPSEMGPEGGGGGSAGGGGKGGRWLVLLDAAKACATAPPDLSAVPADFVVLSYYKIFGHPTGLGALVARKDALALLAAGKSYFGGGTVEVSVADRPYYVRRSGAAGLEDGTPAFTSIAAARHGFAFLRRLGGLPAVHRRSCCLARWLATRLAALRHANGEPACVLYGKWCAAATARAGGDSNDDGVIPFLRDHGPTLSFNLRRPDGSWVGYAEVGRLAALHGLILRTGCFCNPGACAEWLGLSAEDLIRHHSAGHVCWDDHDLEDGRPTGAVRVSLGAASTFTDVFALLQLVRRYFLDGGSGGSSSGGNAAADIVGDRGAEHSLPPAQVTGGRVWMERAPPEQLTAAQEELQRQRRRSPVAVVPAGTAAAAAAAVTGAAAAHSADDPQSDGPRSRPLQAQLQSSSASWTLRQVPCSQARGELSSSLSVATAAGGEAAPVLAQGASTSRGSSPLVHGGAAVDRSSSSSTAERAGGGADGVGRLSRIRLHPVKSCAPQEVAAWPIGPTGLLYDREWALVDDSDKVLTLKQCPRMALVRPAVDLTRGLLTIHAPAGVDVAPLELAIPGLFRQRQCRSGAAAAEAAAIAAATTATSAEAACGSSSVVADKAVALTAVRHRDAVRLDAGLTVERVQVCGDTVCSDLADVCRDSTGDARVRQWFVRVLGAPCRIVQQRSGARKVRRPAGQVRAPAAAAAAVAALHEKASQQPEQPQPQQQPQQQRTDGAGAEAAPLVGFANDGQYLLVSEASMDDLRARLRQSAELGGVAAAATAASSGDTSGAFTIAGADGGAGAPAASEDKEDLLTRLRPNLVVSGFLPYEEDSWGTVRVGPLCADVLGTCPRCELLQVDPRVGVRRGSEVLVALAQYRRIGGRVQFGVLLAASAANSEPQARARGASSGFAGEREMEKNGRGAGVTTESERSGEVLEGFKEWLRQEFGPFSVVAVGDLVQPTVAI